MREAVEMLNGLISDLGNEHSIFRRILMLYWFVFPTSEDEKID